MRFKVAPRYPYTANRKQVAINLLNTLQSSHAELEKNRLDPTRVRFSGVDETLKALNILGYKVKNDISAQAPSRLTKAVF